MNYKAEIDKDGKFICYISRQSFDYVSECGLDFKVTPHSPRLFISLSELKNAGVRAAKTAESAKKDDWFLCYFKHIEFLIIPELALEFESSSFHDKILISNDAYMAAIEENDNNKNNYVKNKK